MKKFIFGAIVAIIGYAFFTGDIDFYEVKDSVLEFISEAKANSDNIISDDFNVDNLFAQAERKYKTIHDFTKEELDNVAWFGTVKIYMNDNNTVTVKRKGKSDKVYNINDIPVEYFYINHETGYDGSFNLPCIKDGKFVFVNFYTGDVVDTLSLNVDDYYIKPISGGCLHVFDTVNDNIKYLIDINMDGKVKVREF